MKIDHVALYCLDLEGMREFFICYFNGMSNEMYHIYSPIEAKRHVISK